jgi:hypothetical protein
MAIAPHEVDTAAWIFSTGWWSDSKGDPKQLLINVASGQPAPNQITPASGTVIYKLTQISMIEPAGSPERVDGGTAPFAVGYSLNKSSGQQTMGYIAVQLRTDGTVAIDVTTSANLPTGLSANPRVYWR